MAQVPTGWYTALCRLPRPESDLRSARGDHQALPRLFRQSVSGAGDRLDQRPPLEAQLIDLADEIAYDTADLDDGLRSSPAQRFRDLAAACRCSTRFYREAEQAYPTAIDKLKFNEALKRVLDRMVGDLIRNLQNQITAAGIRSVEDVRTCPHRLATFSPEVEEERRGAKEFLYRNLYFSAALDPEKDDAERVIRQLFELWMAKPESLPRNYQEKARQGPLARVVCDYIAGMTDNFIYEQYEKYCGSKLGFPK